MEGERTILRPFRVGTCMGPCSGGYRLRLNPRLISANPPGSMAALRLPELASRRREASLNSQTSTFKPLLASPVATHRYDPATRLSTSAGELTPTSDNVASPS